MSVQSTTAVATGATAQTGAKPDLDPPKAMFSQVYGVVGAAQERLAAKLDTNQDGGLDLQELSALGGMGSGKNGPAAFAALDSNGDGALNLEELKGSQIFSPETLNMLLGQQAGNGLAEWLATEGDADADGALTLEEFRAVGPNGPFGRTALAIDSGSPSAIDWAERAFTRADADRDGKVSATELTSVAQHQIRRIFPAQNANALATNLMTRDHDGSGGLSRAELARDDADAILETADADKDGEITLAELQAEVARSPDYYTSGLTRIVGPPLERIDPSDPNSRVRIPEGYVAAFQAQLPGAGEAGLLRLFREEMLRLTQSMLDEVAKPEAPAAA